jgi:adenine-specific DNA-methyltransferase
LIYIDPPFATGMDFAVSSPVGEGKTRRTRARPSIADKAYRDAWGAGVTSYLDMMHPRLKLLRELLAPQGSIFVHLDRRVGPHVRLLLDEIFGPEKFINEIVWCYTGPSSPRMRSFANKHDLIFWYARGDRWTFNVDEVRLPYAESTKRNEGRRTGWTTGDPDLVVKLNPLGKYPEDWWHLHVVAPASPERNGFPTQKPEALLERIIKAASKPGDLVADFFCGSGTTLAVAEKLGRRWVGCDAGRWPIHTARKRLLALDGLKPCEVLHLGKAEWLHWEKRCLCSSASRPSEGKARDRILDLFGAKPAEGFKALQGRRGESLVHVGKLGEKVTPDEVMAALAECAGAGAPELHVLGWDWDPELQPKALEHAARNHVKLVLFQVPREILEAPGARQGDIKFLQLPSVELEVRRAGVLDVEVALKSLSYGAPDLLPEESRSKVARWSDYIDYWAVAWSPGEIFVQDWAAFRTWRDRELPLVSAPHISGKPGPPRGTDARVDRGVVKVVDIFGTESLHSFCAEVL